MSQQVTRVVLGGREFVIVGTAHVSKESIAEVAGAITAEKPDCVCVELDAARYASMVEGGAWRNLDVRKVLREGKGFLLLANLVLASFQKRLGLGLGVKPGEEMLAAIAAARELGIPHVLCDRDIQVTLRRAWAQTGFWGKNKLLAAMLSSVVSSEKLDAEEIEKLKDKDVLQEMMEELAAYLPAVKKVLIDERDVYLAARIAQAKGDRIVAVVGAGHVQGIVSRLEDLAAAGWRKDLADLETIPAGGWAGRVLPWVIPGALVILFLLGFLRSGWSMSLSMVWKWVLANGGLAALGSLIALAHPLTILVAFVAAPIATLNPFVGIGLFTGMVEAVIRKPRVIDIENVQEDMSSIKGFYRNRITRILLVFLLSSIGGMIGNFVAIPFLSALLRG